MMQKWGKVLIRKGDGIIGLHEGEADWFRFPPPEALKDEPNEFDDPPFAHTGNHHSEETSHQVPGVGHAIQGKWEPAPNGGHMFVDGANGVHFHGMDAMIHRIGEFFRQRRSIGLPAPSPSETARIVQEGIDKYNEEAPSKIPHINDARHRKTVIGPYQGFGDTKHLDRKLYGPDGQYITTTFNRDGETHHLGSHLESSANYAHLHIADAVARSCGMSNRREAMNSLEMLKYPYIYAQEHSYRRTPQGKLEPMRFMIPQNSIPRTPENQFPDEISLKPADTSKLGLTDERRFPRMLSYALHSELPNPYYMDFKRTNRGRRAGSTSVDEEGNRKGLNSQTSGLGMAKQTILEAIGADTHHGYVGRSVEHQDPESLAHLRWTDPDGGIHSLADVLSSAREGDHALLDAMLFDMQGIPALHKLFGRVQPNSPVTALDDHYKNDAQYAGRAHLKHQQIVDHAQHEARDNHKFYSNKQIEASGGDPRVLREMRPNSFNIHGADGVGSNFAVMQASGPNPKAAEGGAQSNWANHDLDDALLSSGELRNRKGGSVAFDSTSRARVPERKSILSGLADMVLTARGASRIPVLSDDEFNEIAPLSSNKFSNLGLHGHSYPSWFEERVVTPDMMGINPDPTPELGGNLRERTSPMPPPTTVPSPVSVLPPVTTTPPPVSVPVAPPPVSEPVAPPPVSVPPPSLAGAGPGGSTQTKLPLGGIAPSPQAKTGPIMSPTQIAHREQLARMKHPELVQVMGAMNPNQRGVPTRRQTQAFQSKLAPVTRRDTGEVLHQPQLRDFGFRVGKAEQERLIDAVERLQMVEAANDDSILKHIPNSNLSVESEFDVHYMAQEMELTTADVRAILHSKGDWERVAKTYDISDKVVKAIKVAFGGD